MLIDDGDPKVPIINFSFFGADMRFFKWLKKFFEIRHVCDWEKYTNVNGCLDPNCPYPSRIPKLRPPAPKSPPPPGGYK